MARQGEVDKPQMIWKWNYAACIYAVRSGQYYPRHSCCHAAPCQIQASGSAPCASFSTDAVRLQLRPRAAHCRRRFRPTDHDMNLAAYISRIDWSAAAFLLIGLLIGYLAFALIVRRRAAVAEPPIIPSQTLLDAESRERMRLVEEAVDELRAELVVLRQEVNGLKTVRSMAPQYGEAMSLAGRGASAQTIADNCGISVAEAELVRALSRDNHAGGRRDGR
jgi:hypothetical protein